MRGFGPGLPFPDLQETELPSTLAGEDGRPLTENDHPTGHNGYVSPPSPGKGIHSVFYKDGPAGIGQTGWPGEMLLACSFDREVLRAMGDASAGSAKWARWTCGWPLPSTCTAIPWAPEL